MRRLVTVAAAAFMAGSLMTAAVGSSHLAPITLQPGQRITIIAAPLPTAAPPADECALTRGGYLDYLTVGGLTPGTTYVAWWAVSHAETDAKPYYYASQNARQASAEGELVVLTYLSKYPGWWEVYVDPGTTPAWDGSKAVAECEFAS